MMSSNFLEFSVQIALVFLSATFLITVLKVIKGPTLPDRVLALDMLVAVAIGFTAVLGIKTGFTLYLDIAIALGLVGFLATIAFARFILARGQTEELENNQATAALESADVSNNKPVTAKRKTKRKPTTKRKTKSKARS